MKHKAFLTILGLYAMKILCISDNEDPLLYNNSVGERFQDIDVILSAGDLDSTYYDFLVSRLNVPLFFVFGNHNLNGISEYRKEYAAMSFVHKHKDSIDRFSGMIYTGGSCRRHEALLIAGLGGSRRYNNGWNQFTEFSMALYALRLLPGLLYNRLRYGRFLDVLLTHAAPWGIHDRDDTCHRGFRFFLFFMRIFKPDYLVHGHVHLYDPKQTRVSRYADTTVVNAYNHYVIELED